MAVKLGEHVVEQEERRLPPALGRQAGLGEHEREDGDPLLTLRAEAPKLAAGSGDAHVAQMRAGTREAPLDVSLESLGELGPRSEVAGRTRARAS